MDVHSVRLFRLGSFTKISANGTCVTLIIIEMKN